MHLSELKQLHVSQLLEKAESYGIENANRMRKQELIFAMLKAMAKRGEISKGKVAEYERETKKDLPEKVKSDENRAAAKAKAVKFKKKKEMTERG
jgi:transcription termination factor Rho